MENEKMGVQANREVRSTRQVDLDTASWSSVLTFGATFPFFVPNSGWLKSPRISFMPELGFEPGSWSWSWFQITTSSWLFCGSEGIIVIHRNCPCGSLIDLAYFPCFLEICSNSGYTRATGSDLMGQSSSISGANLLYHLLSSYQVGTGEIRN